MSQCCRGPSSQRQSSGKVWSLGKSIFRRETQINFGNGMMDFGRCKEAWQVVFMGPTVSRVDSSGWNESQTEDDAHD